MITSPLKGFFSLTSSPFGTVTIVWSRLTGVPMIHRIIIPHPGIPSSDLLQSTFPQSRPHTCDLIDGVTEKLQLLLHGHDAEFRLEQVRMDLCSPFQREVLLAEYRIPRGRIASYGQIASSIGVPGGARAVGSALSRNPFPLIIPCHRALRSDGTPGGYQGGSAMKKRLLEMEGIAFDEHGRIASREHFCTDLIACRESAI
jgi:methylated-DNA-[protein]-cysteine S-methyltransferase